VLSCILHLHTGQETVQRPSQAFLITQLPPTRVQSVVLFYSVALRSGCYRRVTEGPSPRCIFKGIMA
jgi:hypothetical protein